MPDPLKTVRGKKISEKEEPPDRLLTVETVARWMAIGRSTLRLRMQEGRAPKHLRFESRKPGGTHRIFFQESTVKQWLDAREATWRRHERGDIAAANPE